MTEEVTAKFLARACCSDRPGPVAVLYEQVGVSSVAKGSSVLAPIPVARVKSTAIHEATHAVVAVALGGRLGEVRVDHPAQATTFDLSRRATIVMTIAAIHGENWSRRWEVTAHTDDLREYAERIHGFGGGGCDMCSSMRGVMYAVGGGASPDDMIAAYRRYEAVAIRIVKNPAIMRAIAALADALMVAGILTGPDATAIITPCLTGLTLNQELEISDENT